MVQHPDPSISLTHPCHGAVAVRWYGLVDLLVTAWLLQFPACFSSTVYWVAMDCQSLGSVGFSMSDTPKTMSGAVGKITRCLPAVKAPLGQLLGDERMARTSGLGVLHPHHKESRFLAPDLTLIGLLWDYVRSSSSEFWGGMREPPNQPRVGVGSNAQDQRNQTKSLNPQMSRRSELSANQCECRGVSRPQLLAQNWALG